MVQVEPIKCPLCDAAVPPGYGAACPRCGAPLAPHGIKLLLNRLGLRKQLLTMFDTDKDGKLTGAEREAAAAWLSRGVPAPRPRGYGLADWDADGNGKLGEAETKARGEYFRKRAEDSRKRYELRIFNCE